MSKVLKAWEKAKFDLNYHRSTESNYYYPKKEREEYSNTIETALKALEIILELTEPKLYKMDDKPRIRLNCGKIGACYPLNEEQCELLKNLLEQKG